MKNVIYYLGIILIIAGTYVIYTGGDEKLGADKVLTDGEWAKEVESEGVHIRSNSALKSMLDATKKTRDDFLEENRKFIDCPECVVYDVEQNFIAQDVPYTNQMVNDEVARQTAIFTERKANMDDAITKIEREIELRNKGFLVPDKNDDGSKKSASELQSVDPTRIRKIYD